MYRVEDGSQAYLFTAVSHTALGTKLVPGSRHRHPPWRILPFCQSRSLLWRTRLMFSSITRRVWSMERKKALSLASLVLQTTCLVLTIRYSRTAHVTGPRYLTSTAVILSEILKLIVCFVMLIITKDRSILESSVSEQVRETVRLMVPSGLYTIQNNLQFVAVSNLDAATFQVTYQLKILTTAMFSVLFLKRQLGASKWASLILLTVGVALVQMPATRTCQGDGCVSVSDVGRAAWLSGLSAVIAMCVSSGFAGVYFEKVLKTSQQSVWVRNVQLAFSAVLFGVLCAVVTDYDQITKNGFFQGYDVFTWIIVIQQAALGLVVSLVIKYADNILKGFAASISIVLSSLVSAIFLADLSINMMFALGAMTVISATFLYSCDPGRLLLDKPSKSETV